jgi:hypothetical protein
MMIRNFIETLNYKILYTNKSGEMLDIISILFG